MSVLISDPSLCTNEFCRLLFSSTGEWSFHARVANITQTGSGISHHTEYQIIITVVPRNSLELDSRQFTLWTRFRDLSRLWSQLNKIHQQLYLHGAFPQFAHAKLFGSADPSVISERVDATTRLLNFVFASEVLRKAKVLLQFFEGVTEIDNHSDTTTPLVAASRNNETSSVSSIANTESSAVQVFHDPSDQNSDGLHFTAEEASLIMPSHIMGSNMYISSESRPVSHSNSSSCLFDFPDVSMQVEMELSMEAGSTDLRCPTATEESLESSEDHHQHHSFIEKIFPKLIASGGRSLEGTVISSSDISSENSNVRGESNFYSVIGAAALSGVQQSSTNTSLYSVPMGPPSSSAFRSLRASVTSDKRNDYLVHAAQFISAAQKAESDRAFELAFHCYKSAVNALLQGVQYERDLPRRNAVRKKTAKYLLKAEKLYHSYLSFDGSTFDIDSWLSNAVNDPSLIAFQSSNSLLKSYRIIGILPSAETKNRVFLVEDRSNASKYVMKLLEKTGRTKSSRILPNCTVVPMHIRNMVQLIKFFDTDAFVILLLEYIKCGRLWDFLGEYFEECKRRLRCFMESEPFRNDVRDSERASGTHPTFSSESIVDSRNCASNEQNPDDSAAQNKPDVSSNSSSSLAVVKKNTYEGKHVRFSVGAENEEPTDLAVSSAFERFFKHLDRHKQSSSSQDSFETAECSTAGAAATEISEEKCEEDASSNTGFNSVLQDTVSSSTVDYFSLTDEVDEEAPAPINLSNRSERSGSTASHRCSNISDSDLTDSLKEVKGLLSSGKTWKRNKRLPEALVVHWTAQLVNALFQLHSQGIIVRDLRPDNLLIDEEGNLKLTYCSQWHNVEFRTDEDAIINRYSAPEVCSVTKVVNDGADRWSVGAIMFELICGQKMHEVCLHGVNRTLDLPIPECVEISFAARDLLSRLLLTTSEERITDDEIKVHPFFGECDWRLYAGASSFQSVQSKENNRKKETALKVGNADPSSSSAMPKPFMESLNASNVVMVVGETDAVQSDRSW